MNDRTRSIIRLHCLHRLAKLQAKLEQPDWGMSVKRELGLLMQTQNTLTLMLHDLGIEYCIAEDLDVTDQLDRKS
jgi:hypothetical protein